MEGGIEGIRRLPLLQWVQLGLEETRDYKLKRGKITAEGNHRDPRSDITAPARVVNCLLGLSLATRDDVTALSFCGRAPRPVRCQ